MTKNCFTENDQNFSLRMCHGGVVITTAQPHSANPDFKFCASSNPAGGVSEVCNDENLR